MNGFLLWAVVFGPVLLAEGLLARYELLIYGAGWRAPATELPAGVPPARGADPERPPDAYLVYLDGIGKRRVGDSRDGGQLVKALLAGAPELRVLGQVQPYSPLADPLADRPVWVWLRRWAGLLLFLHNVMQIFVAADHRYRPLYNRAVGTQIATQLQLAGYQPGSAIPVVLLSYSGGAQVATGAVDVLHTRLRSPQRADWSSTTSGSPVTPIWTPSGRRSSSAGSRTVQDCGRWARPLAPRRRRLCRGCPTFFWTPLPYVSPTVTRLRRR